MRNDLIAIVVLVGAMGLFVGFVVAGDTTPPAGPVAGTMKTLDDVEPRIPIGPATTPGDADSTYRIAAPGSYYLTGNITGESGKRGIEIGSDNVTLDLMGFTMTGVVGSLEGVSTDLTKDGVTVRNGVVSSWGSNGVYVRASAEGAVIDSIRATGNGANGIDVFRKCIVVNCVARENTLNGIRVQSESIVRYNIASLNGGNGLSIGNDSIVIGNTADDNGEAGIYIFSGDTRVDSNLVTDNDLYGIHASSSGALIIRNTAAGNVIDYEIAAHNKYGSIVNITAGGQPAVSGSSAASTVATTDPWANFAF